MPEIVTTADAVAALCARRRDEWQLAAMTPVAAGAPPPVVELVITWHDGSGWGGERRTVEGLRVTVHGVRVHRLEGAHEPGTTIGYCVPAEAGDGVGLLVGVPGDLEVVGDRIEVEPVPARVEIAPYRVNPGRVTVDAPQPSTAGGWRRALAAAGGDVDVWADGLIVDDDDARPVPGLSWALYPRGVAHGGDAGVWMVWHAARGPGSHATFVRQVACAEPLWLAVRRALGALDGARLTCGNVRFSDITWRRFVADGTLPEPEA